MTGRRLVSALADTGAHEVVAPTRSELDLLDLDAVASFTRCTRPEIVVHAAAAVAGLGAHAGAQARYFEVNVRLGLNVLSAAAALGDQVQVLYIGTAAMYPQNAASPIAEEALETGPLHEGNHGYSSAKLAVSKYCSLLDGDGALVARTVVPCNLYGPGDPLQGPRAHVVASAFRKVLAARGDGGPVEVWGDGSARRELMYVDDLVDFLVRAVDDVASLPPLVNVGPGEDVTIADCYRAVASAVGYDGELVFDPSKPSGPRQRVLDCARARAWGWRPQHSFEEGIALTYESLEKGV